MDINRSIARDTRGLCRAYYGTRHEVGRAFVRCVSDMAEDLTPTLQYSSILVFWYSRIV